MWCGGCNHRHPGNWNRNILGMTEPLKKGGWKTNLSPFGARPIFRGENLWPTAHWIYLQDADGFVRFEIDWCNFPKGFPCCWPHGVIGFCQKNCDHKSDTTHMILDCGFIANRTKKPSTKNDSECPLKRDYTLKGNESFEPTINFQKRC